MPDPAPAKPATPPIVHICEDSGQPAVGQFDITYFKVENGKFTDEVASVTRGRWLTQAQVDARIAQGNIVTPSAPASG